MPTKEQKKRKIRRRKRSGAVRVIAAAIILAVLALGAWLVWENRPQSTVMTYPVEYVDLIRRYSEENGVNPAYTAAVILAESSYRPEAVSSVNAQGLMQILPSTGEWLAGKYDEAYVEGCLFDPETNIRYGCWYLGFLAQRFQGDPVSVACAYHAGQGEISSWLTNPSISSDGMTMKIDRLPEGPTKTYAGRVTRDYGIYQAKYFSPVLPDPADPADAAP